MTVTLGTARQAQINPAASGSLMTMLANAYNNPVAAVIRELLTNAVDAQHMAGVTTPILFERYLDDQGLDLLRVTDAGVGMSALELDENFTDAGLSTKVGDNEAVGQFGIGANALYGVVTDFTVVTTKGGVTTTAEFHVDPMTGPSRTVTGHEYTGARSGTEITVAVHTSKYDEQRWRTDAADILSYFTPGVIDYRAYDLAGQIDYVLDHAVDGYRTDNVALMHNPRRRQVLMHHVGYQLPERLKSKYSTMILFIADPGSLQLTHTREAIMDTPENEEVLDRYFADWTRTHIQMHLDTLGELGSVYARWQYVETDVPRDLRRFVAGRNHHSIDHTLRLKDPGDKDLVVGLWYLRKDHDQRPYRQRTDTLGVQTPGEAVYYYGYEPRVIAVDCGDLFDPDNPTGSSAARRFAGSARTYFSEVGRQMVLLTSRAKVESALADPQNHYGGVPLFEIDDLEWVALDEFRKTYPARTKRSTTESTPYGLPYRSDTNGFLTNALITERPRATEITATRLAEKVAATPSKIVVTDDLDTFKFHPMQDKFWRHLATAGAGPLQPFVDAMNRATYLITPRRGPERIMRDSGAAEVRGLIRHLRISAQEFVAGLDLEILAIYQRIARHGFTPGEQHQVRGLHDLAGATDLDIPLPDIRCADLNSEALRHILDWAGVGLGPDSAEPYRVGIDLAERWPLLAHYCVQIDWQDIDPGIARALLAADEATQ